MSDPVADIPVDRIDPNPYQPRETFPAKPQRELMESIRLNGLLQPITVRKSGERYQLLAGERRLRAVREIGLPVIPSIIKELSDAEMRALSLVENIHREDLNPIELSRSMRALMEHLRLTQDEVAERIGKDRSTIANQLRILELPIEIQDDIKNGRLSAGHGRTLLPLKDAPSLHAVRDRVLKRGLSVRETEKLVKKHLSHAMPRKKKTSGRTTAPDIRELENRLSLRLGTEVEIWGESEGSIHVYFPNIQEFNRIFNEIMEKDA